MNPTTQNYSNAALGTDQRSNDLLNAGKNLLKSTPNIDVSTTMNADKIASNKQVNIPFYSTPNNTNNLNLASTNAISKASTEMTGGTEAAKPTLDSYLSKLATQGSDIAAINNEAQLLEKKKNATELSTSIAQYDKEYRDQANQLKKTFQGTTGGLQAELNSLQDRYQNTRANMALSYSVANNDYQGAQEIANQKIQSLKETNAAYLETYKLQADALRNNLTASESKMLDSQLRTKEANDRALTDAYTTAITEASRNGAPASIFNALDAAAKKPGATVIDVYKSLGSYGVNKLEEAYKRAQISSLIDSTTEKKKTNQAIENVSNVDPNSPNYISDKIKASKGGAILTGDQTRPIAKALTVVGQVDSLQSSLQNVNTGPIIGILKSNNPYDVKAQLIKAQLQAIVPNLARGVYGEVGVLTDNDIANYSKTIGNLKSTKDLNNLLLSMTLKIVGNGIDDQLDVYASAGRDVSGFSGLRDRLTSKIDSINSNLGVSAPIVKSGDTKVYNGVTYKVINNVWTPQK